MEDGPTDGRRLSRPPSKYEAGAGSGQGRREGRRDAPVRELKRAKLDDGAEKMQDAGAEKMVPISSVLGKLLLVVMELQAGKQKLRDKASELESDGHVGAEPEALQLQDGKCVVDRAVEALMHTTTAVGVLGSAAGSGGEGSTGRTVQYMVSKTSFEQLMSQIDGAVSTGGAANSARKMSQVAESVLSFLVARWIKNVAGEQVPELAMSVAQVAPTTPCAGGVSSVTPAAKESSSTETPQTEPLQRVVDREGEADPRVLNFVKADRQFQDGFLEELRTKTAGAFQYLHENTSQAGTRERAVAALLKGDGGVKVPGEATFIHDLLLALQPPQDEGRRRASAAQVLSQPPNEPARHATPRCTACDALTATPFQSVTDLTD